VLTTHRRHRIFIAVQQEILKPKKESNTMVYNIEFSEYLPNTTEKAMWAKLNGIPFNGSNWIISAEDMRRFMSECLYYTKDMIEIITEGYMVVQHYNGEEWRLPVLMEHDLRIGFGKRGSPIASQKCFGTITVPQGMERPE
jgi:hypothetical protein